MRNQLKCSDNRDEGNSSVQVYKEDAFEFKGENKEIINIFAQIENNVYRDGDGETLEVDDGHEITITVNGVEESDGDEMIQQGEIVER